jgi:hypothetical protein
MDAWVSSLRAALVSGDTHVLRQDIDRVGQATYRIDEKLIVLLQRYEEMRDGQTAAALSADERRAERMAALGEIGELPCVRHSDTIIRALNQMIDSYHLESLRTEAADRRKQADEAWAKGDRKGTQALLIAAREFDVRLIAAYGLDDARRQKKDG